MALTAMQDGPRQAFYFASLSGAVLGDSVWHALTPTGGGITGNNTLAAEVPSGLKLAIDAVVQVKVWTEFAAAGDGSAEVGIMLNETAIGAGATVRGQMRLLTGATTVTAVYDGWLSARTIIGAVASAEVATTVQGTSYITAVITPIV
jgi:hypothetical protein